MVLISNLTLWKREWSVSVVSGLAGLAFALAVGCMSMSVLLWSGDALAVNECREFPGFGADHYTNPTATGFIRDVTSPNNRPECVAGNGADNYQLGGAPDDRDDRGFPLTAEDDGTRTSPAPEGNIVYSLNDFIKLQTYTPPGSTVAVNRPWWQDECTDDEGQMCWTTIAGTVTAVPAGKTIYYRLIDADDTTFDPGDYQAGPLATVDGVTRQIAAPTGATAATDQVATKGADNIADAVHNRLFLNAASPDYPHRAQLHMGWRSGIVVRGVKQRVYLNEGVADRVPRILVNGEDEDGFGRYAAKFDASTDIGMRVGRANFYFYGQGSSNSQNVLIEGGADKVSKIENDQINTEGGSRDGGGIDFGGDAKDMLMQLGNLNGRPYVVRTTVIARSAGEDSSFHAVHFHQDTQRGGFAKLEMRDATIQMLNGGDTAPEDGRGMIVTTGTDSSGITISVANPVGDADSDGEATGGINVQVNTPVTIKTSGASSHGIVLNLGYDTDQARRIEALEQRAAVLLEAKHRDTALWVGMTEGTVHRALNNLRATTEQRTGSTAGVPGYEPSVRIATNGDKSGGIVIRNSGASEEGGQHVRLGGLTVTFDDTGTGGNEARIASVDNSPDFADDPASTEDDLDDYFLVVDKPIVTTGANSHGVVASIGESGIMMVVDIKGFADDTSTTVDESEARTISTGPVDDEDTWYRAFDGSGSAGRFTVNVEGHVKGDIMTGDGVASSDDKTSDTINVGKAGATDDDPDLAPTIRGKIDAGGGDDTVNVKFGTVIGTVGGSGTGCDTVDLSVGVTVGGVTLGLCQGANKKNVLDTEVNIAGDVKTGGTTELNLAGRTVGSVTLTGSGTTTVDGGTLGSIGFSAAAGTASKVVVGSSTNTVTITGNIEGGAGNDEVELSSGTIFSVDDTSTADENEASMISLGAGDDTLTYTAVRLSGGTAAANARRNLPAVDAGAGCDTITLSASGSTETGTDSTAGNIDLGACEGSGMDRLTSNIVIEGNIESSGNSQIRLNGGSLNGNLALGAGDDDVVLGNGASISGTISLGAGNNMLTSSQVTVLTSIASDSAGASGDTPAESTTVHLNSGGVSGGMTFGAGNDVARWVGAVTVSGAVVLGGGDDIVDGGRMIGSIAGGDGDDTVTLIGGAVSMMTGVETFNKMGISTLTVGSMSNPAASASTLSGSTAAAGEAITVNVNQGKLVVSGHLDLGSTGTLTVKKDAFLSFDISGMASQYQDGGTVSHGRITAGEVVLVRALPEIELVSGSAAPVATDIAAVTVSRLINGKVVRQAGDDEEIVPAIVRGGANPGVISPGTDSPGAGPGAAADDDDNTAIYAVGALAVLWWVMRKDDMGSGSGLVDYESGTAERSFATISGSQTHSSGAMKTWANYYSDSASPVQGLAVGMEAPISSNGSFSFSAMPEAKGSLSLNTLSLNQKSSFQGGHYSVKGKWQSEDYFATAELSYADAVSSTSFDNPTAGGKLSGKFDMTNSHLEIGAGAKVQLTDTLSVAPTIGVYGGSISQSESVLTGRSVVARMSKQEQSYTGWNLGIRVQPDAWTTDGAEFQPNFSLNTFRTSSDSRSLDLRQSDKAGVLDFSSQLPVQGMPAVVNAFRAGMTMKSETGLKLDLDYVGMEIDGELQHGAIARMQTRF